MPSLRELRASIRNQAAGHIVTDDTRLRNRFIDKLIRDKRSALIMSEAKRGLGVDPHYYQTISCLNIEDDELVCDGENTGVIVKSVKTPPVESFRGSIAHFGSIDHSFQFEYRALSAFINYTNGRFCSDRPVYTITAGKSYLKNIPAGMCVVKLIAVLENPQDDTCIKDFERTDYPIPNSRVHTLELMCLKQLMSTAGIVPDEMNNAADDSTLAGAQPKNLD